MNHTFPQNVGAPSAVPGAPAFTRRIFCFLALVGSFTAQAVAGNFFSSAYPNKARYNRMAPYYEVPTVYVEIYNTNNYNFSGTVTLSVVDDTGAVSSMFVQNNVVANMNTPVTIAFNCSGVPSTNYKGYLVEIRAFSGGTEIDFITTAFDFSESWHKFPRYGYLSKFYPTDNVDLHLQQMRNYLISGVQFYDWADKHHKPVPEASVSQWSDIGNRTINRQKVTDGINYAKTYGMVAMAYGLMNGAYADYQTDGTEKPYINWGQFLNSANPYDLNDQDSHTLPVGWETPKIYLFNPASTDWQNYICNQYAKVFTQFPLFDGWHIDTVGWRQTMLWPWEGGSNGYEVKNTLPPFINYVKSRFPNKRISFNPVGTFAIDTVAQNAGANLDIFYDELWDNDSSSDDYQDILTLCDRIRTNTDKSIVFAAYMNTGTAQAVANAGQTGLFNEPSVLLTNAVMFANGAAHCELGDGAEMLSTEYFAYTSLCMYSTLRKKLRDYYVFMTAYQNLLRDGAVTDNKQIWLGNPGTPSGYNLLSSYTAEPYKVWKMSKRQGANTIVHLINLDNNWSTQWKNNEANYTTPDNFYNIPLKIYYTGALSQNPKVFFASPDVAGGNLRSLFIEQQSSDAAGTFVKVTVPELHYWSMIWLKP